MKAPAFTVTNPWHDTRVSGSHPEIRLTKLVAIYDEFKLYHRPPSTVVVLDGEGKAIVETMTKHGAVRWLEVHGLIAVQPKARRRRGRN